jgi:two-component system NtrC family sensor kinase
MRRRAKPTKAKVNAELPGARKSRKNAEVRDLEKRLAESLEREKATGRALTESLEQQTATSEILRVIASSPTDERPVFETIVGSARRLLDGHTAGLRTLHGNELHISAFTSTTASGDSALAQGPIAVIPVSSSAHFSRVVKDRTPSVVEDSESDLGLLPPGHRLVARARGYRSGLTVPLLRGETVLGLINVTRRAPGPFSADDIALLQTFAAQAVIAIENVRLFKELEEKNRALTQAHAQVTESLEQQTVTSEILRVISSSPTDVQPVFDAIVRSASRLCGGEYAIVTRYDGQLLHLAAQYNPRPGTADETARFFPQAPRREASLTPRAFVDARMVHVPDVDDAEDLEPSTREFYRRIGLRAALAMPMIHEGSPIGVVSVSRGSRGPFSDRQIALLQTFADQAVIAIENVRLFNETKEALERQTATAEILRVISSSPTDIQPVLNPNPKITQAARR